MNIAPDKILHLKAGALAALVLLGIALLAMRVGPGWAVAAGSIVMGWGVERYQAVRREGVASLGDMLASALPGIALGIAIEVWRVVA